MREAHAVIERQLVVHAPVVLDVAFDLVVDELAFHERRLLRVGRVDADGRIREAEPRVEGIVRVVIEAELSLERQRVALVQVLLLPAVVAVDAGFIVWRPRSLVTLIDTSCVGFVFRNAGYARFGGWAPMRLPHE